MRPGPETMAREGRAAGGAFYGRFIAATGLILPLRGGASRPGLMPAE